MKVLIMISGLFALTFLAWHGVLSQAEAYLEAVQK